MRIGWLLVSLALAVSGPGPKTSPGRAPIEADPELKDCLIALIDEAQVPGREPGVLVNLSVKEGAMVKEGDVVAGIDDSEPTVQRKIKTSEYNVAKEQATNDIDVRFARKATEVAKKEWEKNVEANRKVPGSVTQVELDRLRLTWEKSELSIEKAQLDQKVARLTAETKGSEVEATELSIKRRLIKSPLDGVVVKTFRHVGEWVPPGETVVHIVRIDKLRVEGTIKAAQFDPQDIDGHDATVRVELARGRVKDFPGKIVFVSPLVEAGGRYKVRAEVENLVEDDHWLLRPGLHATMTIHLQ